MHYQYKVSRHPIEFVRGLTPLRLRGGVKMHYSIYSYKPHTFIDNRKEYALDFTDLNEEWLNDVITSLLSDQELAIHSLVNIGSEIYHIPMIDLGGRSNEIENITLIKSLANFWNINFDIYASGHSYHAYGDRLLSSDEWVKFMGSLLLLNVPGKNKIIDTRWVGHRLIGGYSSLRWSNNTSQYKRYPTRIGSVAELADRYSKT